MARILEQVKGHNEAIETLLAAVTKDRLASTLLFTGPAGVGKKLTAFGLAQALVCEKSRNACGECGSCLRIEKKQSESLMFIEATGLNIKIEQAREVVQFISLRNLGRARVIIIDDVHLMNPQAANALLKSLEEPPVGTYFFLLSSNAGAVLPTIRSRSQLVRFQPLSEKNLQALTGAESWMIKSAQGSVENVQRMQEEEGAWQELRAKALHLFSEPVASFPAQMIGEIKDLAKERAAAVFVAHSWQTYFRDLMHAQVQDKNLINADFPELFTHAQDIPIESLHHMSEKAFELEQDLARNVDKNLAFENFWMEWQRSLR